MKLLSCFVCSLATISLRQVGLKFLFLLATRCWTGYYYKLYFAIYSLLILLFFIFSNSKTTHTKFFKIPSLQVRFKRKLLKKFKKNHIHPAQINWKTVTWYQFPVSVFHFNAQFRNYKKNTFKKTPLL